MAGSVFADAVATTEPRNEQAHDVGGEVEEQSAEHTADQGQCEDRVGQLRHCEHRDRGSHWSTPEARSACPNRAMTSARVPTWKMTSGSGKLPGKRSGCTISPYKT